jgi:membrane glycosyltransferase
MDQVIRSTSIRTTGPVPSSNGHGLLPAETPLDMPTQPLHLPQAAHRGRDRLTWPRALLVALASIAVAAFAHLLYQVLSVVQLTVLQGVFLVLCTMCFAWIALGTSSAVLGFFSFRQGRDVAEFDAMAADGVRTALLFPVYQEDTARIAATVECIAQELVALGAEKRFDVFVLSDSPAGRHQGQGAACRALPAPAPAQCLSNLLPVQGTERRQEGRQHR